MRTDRNGIPWCGGVSTALSLATALLISASCKGQQSSNPEKRSTASEAKQPTIPPLPNRMQGEVPKKMREVPSSPEMVAEGKRQFNTYCVGCHGDEGEGRIGTGPRLVSKSFLAAASDNLLSRTINHGRAGTTMVPWRETLTQDQIQGIIAYLRSLAPAAPAVLDERPLSGDLGRGAQVFSSICAGCHGQSGAGYQETANGTGIGRRVFLTSVSNGFLRYVIKHGKDQTKMRPFAVGSKVAVANLNDQQIDDVITYLRTRAW